MKKGRRAFALTALAACALCLCIFACQPQPYNAPFPAWSAEKARSFNFYPLRWGNKVVLAGRCQRGDCLQCIDLEDGRTEWELSDSAFSGIYYNCTPYLHGSRLLLPIGKELICVGLAEGKIAWRDRKEFSGESHLYGEGSRVYRSYYNYGKQELQIFAFNCKSGANELLFERSYEEGSEVLMRSPKPFRDSSGRRCLLAATAAYHPEKSLASHLFVVDEKGNKVLEHQLYPPNRAGRGATRSPIVAEGKSYWQAGNRVICYDLQQQMECWQTELPRGLLTSRMLKVGDTVYAAAEDEYLYALKAEDGSLAWKSKASGTPSRLHACGSRLFLVGGSDRWLYEWQRQNGELVQRYKLRGGRGAMGRPALIAQDIMLLSDARRWYAFDPSARDTVLRVAKSAPHPQE